MIQIARGNNPSQNFNSKRVQDLLNTAGSAEEQQKVKIAFAEGHQK